MGFLFIKQYDPDETIHIFPAYYGKDKKIHTFNDNNFDNIKELESVYENRDKILDIDDDDNEAICNAFSLNDIENAISDTEYLKTMVETRNYAANMQNNGYNICGNCVRRLYKNDEDY